MRKLFLWCAISAFTTLYCISQTAVKRGFDPDVPLQDLAMDYWSNDNGLVSNNVNAVFQSSDDFIWLTSYNGLQKFDGHQFLIYDQTNLPFLNSNAVNNITEANDGTLIFCSQSSGLFELTSKSGFKPLEINDNIPNAITSVLSDSKGVLWMGSTNNGLYKKEIKGRVAKVPLIPNVTVHDIKEDTYGNIWIASDGQGIYRINDQGVENFTANSGLAGDLTMSIAIDKENNVFIGSVNGLNAISDSQVSTIQKLKGTIINNILTDDYGLLWLSTDRGLMRYNPNNDKLEVFDESNGLPGNRVTDLCFDNEGSLWVGTYETGLARFKSAMIHNITIRDGLSTNQIYSIEKRNSAFYIGSQDGKINVLENKKISQIELSSNFQKDVIRDFLFDGDVIWVGNYMGLARIEGNKTTYYNEENGLPSNSIRKIFKSKAGDIWLATRAGGLIKFDPNGKHKIYDKNNGLLTNYVMSIDEDSSGNLFLGTNAGGLSILTKNGVLENHKIIDDDAGSIIFSVRTISEKKAWLATNLGLFYFENGISKLIPFVGLKTQKIFDLIDDKRGNYWLTSSIGVVLLKAENVEAFLKGEVDQVTYELFGEGDGMESQECTGATTSYLDESTGHIWIPTFEGVAIIKPELRVINTKKPKVIITGMQVDNILINPIQNNLTIKPGNFRYLFDVTALSFLSPSKVQFKYRLAGIERDWNGPSTSRKIEYTNIPYGTYTLEVIGSNNDGIWNTEGDTLTFHVRPYFFETEFFKIGLVIFLVGGLYGLYRWRVRDIRRTNRALTKMNRELDQFVYSASHDLRGPLTSIMGVIDMAVSQDKTLENNQYIKMVQSNTNKLDHFISELINYAKNKNDIIVNKKIHLDAIVAEVVGELEAFRAERKVKVEQLLNSDIVITTDESRLKSMLKNLLHNAIAFSKEDGTESVVYVYAEKRNDRTEVIVKDNGVGIPPKIKEKIFDMFYRGNDQSKGSGLGLYLVRDTCDKLGAQVEVNSRVNEGSEFKLIFPN